MRTLIGRSRFGATVLNALLSFGFAVLIWAAVGARVTASDTFRVPFELEAPPSVVIEYRDPPAPPGGKPLVEVSVHGPHEALARLSASEVIGRRRIEVDDATLEKGGEQTIEIPPSAFRIAIKGVEVTSVSPDRITFAVSRLDTRQFPVEPRFVGTLPAGYQRSDVKIEPSVIDVIGPRALLLEQRGAFKTDPIDLTGRTETFNIWRRVRPPEGLLPQDRVKVTVFVDPELIEQAFTLPVRILCSVENFAKKYDVEPPKGEDWKAKVVLKGSADRLKALDTLLARRPEEGVGPTAFVRLTTPFEAGEVDAWIEGVLNLPADIQFVQFKTKLKFTLKEAKQP